jgi:hypothetical protein
MVVLWAITAALLTSTTAKAVTLFDSGTTALLSTDPTQLGRMSRDGVPSDWSSSKPFPGTINSTTSYHFTTFTVPIINTPFVQISLNEIGGTTDLFASAYLNSYNPLNEATNYLGDAGVSGTLTTFQVIVPVGQSLIVLINDTTATGSGVGVSFDVIVSGFIDANFTDPSSATPLPAALPLFATGLGTLGLLGWRRKRKAN